MTAWIQHLTGVEEHLRLMNAPAGTLAGGRMPEYLYQRTNGVAGLLERLIEDGCHEAIDSRQECLTEELLDGIGISIEGSPGRDPGAGEIPDIPSQPAAGTAKNTSAKRRRGRSTVFDDHGPAAESGM